MLFEIMVNGHCAYVIEGDTQLEAEHNAIQKYQERNGRSISQPRISWVHELISKDSVK